MFRCRCHNAFDGGPSHRTMAAPVPANSITSSIVSGREKGFLYSSRRYKKGSSKGSSTANRGNHGALAMTLIYGSIEEPPTQHEKRMPARRVLRKQREWETHTHRLAGLFLHSNRRHPKKRSTFFRGKQKANLVFHSKSHHIFYFSF